MTKEEYDTKEYRRLCKELFLPVLSELKQYISSDYEILGIIGINESPTCSISGKRGVFMQEIFKILEEENIYLKYFEIPTDYSEKNNHIKSFHFI